MKNFLIIFISVILMLTVNFIALYELLGASLLFTNYNDLFNVHPDLAIKAFGITLIFLILFTIIVTYVFNKSENDILDFDKKFFSNFKNLTD